MGQTAGICSRTGMNPMFAQQIESAKLLRSLSQLMPASRPQAEQLEEGQVVMLKRKGMRNKNTSPYYTTPYTVHPTTERHRCELYGTHPAR
jgi:hypothetical protein